LRARGCGLGAAARRVRAVYILYDRLVGIDNMKLG
jgi:hypothetical protein